LPKTDPIPANISRTLHDRIFKEFFHRFLPEFMQLFFPKEAKRLDFSTLTFLDKELMINLPDQTLRVPDIVAEITTKDGEAEIIIIHIEVEARNLKTLPRRMFEYYSLLRLLKQRKVLPLALLLKPGAGGLNWQFYQEVLFGREIIRFQYGQVGLRDLESSQYLIENNPISATLAVLMRSQESPARTKLEAFRSVLSSDLSEADRLFLMSIIEVYLPKETIDVSGEATMESLNEIELMWHEKIELESQKEFLLNQLETKFGPLPTDLVSQIESIWDKSTLISLGKQILFANTIEEIKIPNQN